MLKRHFFIGTHGNSGNNGDSGGGQVTEKGIILYTTSDGSIYDILVLIDTYTSLGSVSYKGPNIISNTYNDIGEIIFDAPVVYTGLNQASMGIYPTFSASLFTPDDFNIKSLTSVTLPNTVKEIGGYTFLLCSALTAINIPEGVTKIEEGAFLLCTSLQSVDLPNSLKIIGSSAFNLCTSLKSIVIPDSVTSINGTAFGSCTSLTNVYIGSGVTSEYREDLSDIPDTWFSLCPNIETIVVSNSNPKYDSRDNCNAIVNTADNAIVLGCKNTKIVDSIEYVYISAFKGITMDYLYVGKALLSIGSWPTVTNVHFEAVNYTGKGSLPSSLTTCTFGEDVTALPNLNGTSIVSIQIPPKVNKLHYFHDCTNLNEIIIPNSVTTVRFGAFDNTNLYKKVYYLGTIEEWCAIALGSNNQLLGNLYINNLLVENLVIPSTITTIKNYTFLHCPSITSVTLPNSITAIGKSAFSNCINLQTINYEGTMELWRLITLDSNWNLNVPATVVHCTDGNVTL